MATTMSKTRLRAVTSKLEPADNIDKSRTLWRAKLRIQNEKDEFLFRCGEEFTDAATKAQELLETSPSCKMVGAEIIAIERVARLWN